MQDILQVVGLTRSCRFYAGSVERLKFATPQSAVVIEIDGLKFSRMREEREEREERDLGNADPNPVRHLY
jgi:hypothetical protein